MSTDKSFSQYVLDQLNTNLTRVRSMFGEYALYYDDRVVGLICDNTVYLKITPKTSTLLGQNYPTGLAYPGAKPSFQISEEILEDSEFFRKLLASCSQDVPLKKGK